MLWHGFNMSMLFCYFPHLLVHCIEWALSYYYCDRNCRTVGSFPFVYHGTDRQVFTIQNRLSAASGWRNQIKLQLHSDRKSLYLYLFMLSVFVFVFETDIFSLLRCIAIVRGEKNQIKMEMGMGILSLKLEVGIGIGISSALSLSFCTVAARFTPQQRSKRNITTLQLKVFTRLLSSKFLYFYKRMAVFSSSINFLISLSSADITTNLVINN